MLAVLLPLGALGLQGGDAAAWTPRVEAADTVPLDDPIARLQARIDLGEVVLASDTAFGYLPALLEELQIPVSSQGLVFSRTSLQTDKITPWSPRAIYFNDDVYIGYVQGSHFLEIASIDPVRGATFYTLSQEPSEKPSFELETTACLMCHNSRTITEGVPGLMVLSTLADRHGYPITGVHEGPTYDRTPHEERWGGWYVTGQHGTERHAGNVYAEQLAHEVADKRRFRSGFTFSENGNVETLEKWFDPEAYLTGHSDIVALMVLAHQTKVHNLITVVHEQAKAALSQEEMLRSAGRAEGVPEGEYLPATRAMMVGEVERLVRGLLFSREAPMSSPIRGTSGYAEEFSARGPRDSRGRSLRELDLERRLFRYPLSFLIYTEAFDALPDLAKRMVYERLWAILKGGDQGEDYQHLSPEDRQAILEILVETRPDFSQLTRGMSTMD